MPTLVVKRTADQAKLDHIRSAVHRAAVEDWSLAQLASTLGVTERMARNYLDRFEYDTTLLIRPKGRTDGR